MCIRDRIRRVPNQLAQLLQEELEKRIELNGIYFARRKDKNRPQWGIHDNKNKEGEIDPAFKDIVLSFAPSGALKTLAEHVLGEKEILKFHDIEIDKKVFPRELGYAPYALAVGRPERWNGAWPEVIHHHILHWAYNKLARKYAEKDVHYTRALYHHFDDPEPGDVDSELACMVGAVRWRGFRIDREALKVQRDLAIVTKEDTPVSPNGVKGYLHEVMSSKESIILMKGTGKLILESICGAPGEEGWMKDNEPHPAAIRAQAVIDARKAIKEIELFDKLLLAGRFHASFKIIGTKSSRMSGADGLNPQGIRKTTEVRSCFPFTEDGFVLGVGDFDAFEVCISEAVYKDPKLRADLLAGKKIHALFAMELFDMSYDDVMASKDSKVRDYYTDGKRGVFGMNYGGDADTLVSRLGICLLYTSPSPRDRTRSRMPSSA